MTSLVPRFGDGRDWWFTHRYGMFVHWGLYTLHGWHEQEQWRRRVPRSEYQKLASRWNPTEFNPEEWLDLAQAAGMEYLCVTTKHHDGFCLWDTKLTAYNTMNTPYGKDIVQQVADACHQRNFPLCLYYSIADWHHPSYPNQGRHHEIPAQPEDTPDLLAYTEFVREQVRELCTNYGEIHGFWWDMNVDLHRDPSVNALIRQLQPKAVINDRGYDEGDFGTPERDFETKVDFTKRVEACQSVGMESWSWRKDEDYYSDRHLMRSIAKYRARDANYLLNVGPKADGTIPQESAAILERIGKWYQSVREAFEGTTPCRELTTNRNILLTRKDNLLYVICPTDLVGSAITLKPLALAATRATLLNTGKPLGIGLDIVPSDHVEQQAFLRLTEIPVNLLSATVPVIKLELAP
nr:alpha-L-fucosidase [Armatimonas sp.]